MKMKNRMIRKVSCLTILIVWLVLPLTASKRIGKQNMKAYDGIDVSHHQGRIDWKQVARDPKIRFVYIKATQGATIKDPRYASNITNARRHGLRCGSYHYLSSQSSVRQQFRFFKSTAKKLQQDLIPMIDIEPEGVRRWSHKQVRDSLALFCRLVKAHYGKSPLIYTHYSFYNACLAPKFNNYFLFLCKYSWPPPQIRGAGHHNVWQYSERGKIKGIKGHVDLDRLMSGTKLSRLKL